MKNLIPIDKKIVANSVIAIGLLLLFLIFAHIPKHRVVAGLETNLKSMEQQIKVTQVMLGDLGRLAQVLVDMQKELISFESRLPDRKQLSLVLSELTNLAKLSFVDVVSIKPEEPVPLVDNEQNPVSLGTRPLKSLKVELQLRAPYKAIAEYVKSIQDSLNILATIDEINLTTNEEIAPNLDAKLVFTVYIVDKD